ncbi:MAG: hypothetical protein ABEL97_10025 [Salinibacter sp.]
MQTGTIGHRVLRLLSERGIFARALSRDPIRFIPLCPGGRSERLDEIDRREEIGAAENPTELRRDALTFSGLGNFAEVLGADREAIEQTVEEPVQTWNGQIAWRNLAHRTLPGDPERKILVAGERSMGEEPGGAYQVLKRALAVGIAQHFGCE